MAKRDLRRRTPTAVPKREEFFVYRLVDEVRVGDKNYPVLIGGEHFPVYVVFMRDGSHRFWSQDQVWDYEDETGAVPVDGGFYSKGRFIDKERDEDEYKKLADRIKSGIPKPQVKTETKYVTETVHDWRITFRMVVMTYFLVLVSLYFILLSVMGVAS